jgi:hypothetical protein
MEVKTEEVDSRQLKVESEKTRKRITQRRRVNRDSQRRKESQKKEFYTEGHRDTEGTEKRRRERFSREKNGGRESGILF